MLGSVPPPGPDGQTHGPEFDGGTAPTRTGRSGDSRRIKEVAREFEAVFAAAAFKEGLKSAMKTGMDEENGGTSTYVEMTCDHLAQFIGRQGVLGIAEEITAHLRGEAQGERHDQR